MLGVLVLLGAVVCALRMVAWHQGWGWPEDPYIVGLRASRVAAGAAVGGALALAGVLLQTLLRNPLASPDLLGLSSSAALGALATIYAGFISTGVLATQSLAQGPAALAASGLALGLVYVLAQRRGVIDPISMILLGVMIGIIASAGVMLIRHLLPDAGQSTGRWLVGSIPGEVPTLALVLTCCATIAVLAGTLWWAPALDAGTLADDEARSVGVPVGVMRGVLFGAAGILTGLSVWLAGPIGFVGLVCPHLARLLVGPGHRLLAPAALVIGVVLVVGADTAIASVALTSGRLPLGVVTSLLGGPLFIVLLLQQRRTHATGI